jgi:hypothetical protein
LLHQLCRHAKDSSYALVHRYLLVPAASVPANAVKACVYGLTIYLLAMVCHLDSQLLTRQRSSPHDPYQPAGKPDTALKLRHGAENSQ